MRSKIRIVLNNLVKVTSKAEVKVFLDGFDEKELQTQEGSRSEITKEKLHHRIQDKGLRGLGITGRTRSRARYTRCDHSVSVHSSVWLLPSPPDVSIFKGSDFQRHWAASPAKLCLQHGRCPQGWQGYLLRQGSRPDQPDMLS